MPRRDRVTEYAKLVTSDKKIAGRSEVLACERHLKDLEKSKTASFEYWFDIEESEKVLDMANDLIILEGDEPVKLQTYGFQEFILGSLHGWKQKETNYNRFKEAYIQMARQNGKSFISGIEGVQWSSFSGYNEGLIMCAATKMDQAKIVWREIQKFIKADDDLSDIYKVKESENTIISKITGTRIVAIGRDTKSIDGLRAILNIPDELHAHKNNQMYRLLLGGQRKLKNSLTLAITTAGFDLNSFCYEHYKFCKQVLEGVVIKDSQFVFICEMDSEDDIWDYHNWAKANPLLLFNRDNSINMEEVKKMAETASDVKYKGGSELVDFQTKWLNMWVTWKQGMLVDLKHWKLCESDLTIADMKDKECYLGFDLSSGGDLTSIALIFMLENDKIYIYSHSFMPELRLIEHEKSDDAPYRQWVNEGLLTLTSGNFGIKTDYKYITAHLSKLINDYNLDIIGCGYDPANASSFLSDLSEVIDCDLIEVKQTASELNDCTDDFRLSVKANQVIYDKANALLTWSIINAEVTQDSKSQIKVYKEKTESRIDPVDAVIDAWKVYYESKSKNTYNVNKEIDDFLAMAARIGKGGEKM